MPDVNIEILRKETYLKAIENSPGTKLFNSLLIRFKDSGKTVDILDDGELSCAFFVSSVLFLMQAVVKSCSTVQSLKKLIDASPDWFSIVPEKAESGDVVFYKKSLIEDGTESAHVGFVFGESDAISTDYITKSVIRHSIGKREIDCIYRYTWTEEVSVV